MSVTTTSGNAGWIAGSPFSVTTASGKAGWTAGSPLSLTTASGKADWVAGSPFALTTAEFEDCFSSFLGLVNSAERGFSTTWTSVDLVEETGFSS